MKNRWFVLGGIIIALFLFVSPALAVDDVDSHKLQKEVSSTKKKAELNVPEIQKVEDNSSSKAVSKKKSNSNLQALKARLAMMLLKTLR